MGLFRTITVTRAASSFRNFRQTLISGTSDSTDVDSIIGKSKCSIFGRNATDADNSGHVCSGRDWSLSSEISPDCVRNCVTIKPQLVGVTERVTHLVFVNTEPDLLRLGTRLLDDRRKLAFLNPEPDLPPRWIEGARSSARLRS